MRRSMTLLAGAAAATALLASGCSAGQIAETAAKVASVPGASDDIRTPEGLLSVRNAVVVYDNPEGYEAGDNAPLDVRIFNDTGSAVTVTISSPDARTVSPSGGESSPSPSPSPSEPSPSPSGSTSPSPEQTGSPAPSGSPSPSESPEPPPAEPASFEVPAGGYIVLSEAAGEFLELVDLNDELAPGETVKVNFDFGGGRVLELTVPVGIPLSPAARASAEPGEEGH